jgi:hypothetical protein
VPEAYWLVSDYGVTRPGVLVLTPEGRKVDAIPVRGTDPESDAVDLAVTLELAVDAAPEDDALPGGMSVALRFTSKQLTTEIGRAVAAKVLLALRKVAGVQHVELQGEVLVVTGARLWLRPKTIVAVANGLKLAPLQCISHREVVVPVSDLPDTPTTMARCKKMERLEGVVLAVPDLARRQIRFLVGRRTDADAEPSPPGIVQAAGYTLRPQKK